MHSPTIDPSWLLSHDPFDLRLGDAHECRQFVEIEPQLRRHIRSFETVVEEPESVRVDRGERIDGGSAVHTPDGTDATVGCPA